MDLIGLPFLLPGVLGVFLTLLFGLNLNAGWFYGFTFGGLVPGIVLYVLGRKKWNTELAHFKLQRENKLKERAAQEALGAELAAEEEQRQRKTNEEAAQRQREAKDRQRLEMLKSLVEMSEEVLLDDLANALEMPRPDLIRKIAEWGKQFGIKLKGDRVIVAQQDIAGFIAPHDEKMKDWANSEKSGSGKLS